MDSTIKRESSSGIVLKDHLEILTSSAFLRPFSCVGIIYILFQLSGIIIINTYTLTFLEACGFTHMRFDYLSGRGRGRIKKLCERINTS